MQRNLIDFRRRTVWLIATQDPFWIIHRHGKQGGIHAAGVFYGLPGTLGSTVLQDDLVRRPTGNQPAGPYRDWYSNPWMATWFLDRADAVAEALLIGEHVPVSIVEMEEPEGPDVSDGDQARSARVRW